MSDGDARNPNRVPGGGPHPYVSSGVYPWCLSGAAESTARFGGIRPPGGYLRCDYSRPDSELKGSRIGPCADRPDSSRTDPSCHAATVGHPGTYNLSFWKRHNLTVVAVRLDGAPGETKGWGVRCGTYTAKSPHLRARHTWPCLVAQLTMLERCQFELDDDFPPPLSTCFTSEIIFPSSSGI